jgi:periplasmic divalent cation tolerance protein
MSKEQIPLLVLVTVPDHDTGKRIAETLVEERLAACVNIILGIESIYHWEGKVQIDQEAQLLIKSREDLLDNQ